MRINGIVTGKIRNKTTKKFYTEGEEPEEYFNCEVEISDVTIQGCEEAPEKLWLNFGYKASVRYLKEMNVKDNIISFDATKIEGDTVKGVRNICGTKICGYWGQAGINKNTLYLGFNPYCTFCSYRNKDCGKLKTHEEIITTKDIKEKKYNPKTTYFNS